MDANGTRYHLLLGYENWARCRDAAGELLGQEDARNDAFRPNSDLGWDGYRAEVTLEPRLFQYVASRSDRPPVQEDRRGAARDAYGNWYWISPDQSAVRVLASGSRAAADFWPVEDLGCAGSKAGLPLCPPPVPRGAFGPREQPPPPQPPRLQGLAVTTDHYLVVGLVRPGGRQSGGLLVFDLYGSGPPREFYWPEDVDFEPFDLAAMPGGGVWVLDQAHRRYWGLDGDFTPIPTGPETLVSPPRRDFGPEDGSPPQADPRARTFPRGILLEYSTDLTPLDPLAIEALPDCTVLILSREPGGRFSAVYRYRFAEQLGPPVSTGVLEEWIEESRRPGFRLVGHDFAFVPEHVSAGPRERGQTVPDRLYIASEGGNQVFAFDIAQEEGRLRLDPVLDEYLPMRLFSGKGLVAAGTEVYYDLGERWLPVVGQARPRYAPQAVLVTFPLDGGLPGCTWHRLMLDGCIPPDTQVEVWSRAADEQILLPLAVWQAEPSLILRASGSELAYAGGIPYAGGIGNAAGPGSNSGAEGSGTWELLFQRASGRYLQLRLALKGNEQRSPRLRALRAYYPRFSYPEHYLPAVYRQEPEPASFLERYLANLEGFYTAIEDKIAAAQVLLDPRSAPAEALEWLASWFGVVLDPGWDERRRRILIRHAMEFFQYRGTVPGLLMALRLALDPQPGEWIFTDPTFFCSPRQAIRILEAFLTRATPGVVLGDPHDPAGPRLLSAGDRWLPAEGGAELHRRYRLALVEAGIPAEDAAGAGYPIRPPGEGLLSFWRQFSRQVLGFTPVSTGEDLARWQNFLARRYGRIAALVADYGAGFDWGGSPPGDFSAVALPEHLPQDGPALQDWYQFEAVDQSMRLHAHRFAVLLPMPAGLRPESVEYAQRVSLAERMLALEKPAHTVYTLRFYWALFRVGEARLGDDTLLDLGARSPLLNAPAVLDQAYLSENYLAPAQVNDGPGRLVVGGAC